MLRGREHAEHCDGFKHNNSANVMTSAEPCVFLAIQLATHTYTHRSSLQPIHMHNPTVMMTPLFGIGLSKNIFFLVFNKHSLNNIQSKRDLKNQMGKNEKAKPGTQKEGSYSLECFSMVLI